MIKPILKSGLPKNLQKGFVLFQWPLFGFKDIFFIVSQKGGKWAKSSRDFWDFVNDIQINNDKNRPKGIMNLVGLDNEKYFRVTYEPKIVNTETVIAWLDQYFS